MFNIKCPSQPPESHPIICLDANSYPTTWRLPTVPRPCPSRLIKGKHGKTIGNQSTDDLRFVKACLPQPSAIRHLQVRPVSAKMAAINHKSDKNSTSSFSPFHVSVLSYWEIGVVGNCWGWLKHNRGKLDHYPSLKITLKMDGHHEWGGRIIHNKMQTIRNWNQTTSRYRSTV